jgi:DNA repair exonuclease SbcCD ATPase subunit
MIAARAHEREHGEHPPAATMLPAKHRQNERGESDKVPAFRDKDPDQPEPGCGRPHQHEERSSEENHDRAEDKQIDAASSPDVGRRTFVHNQRCGSEDSQPGS